MTRTKHLLVGAFLASCLTVSVTNVFAQNRRTKPSYRLNGIQVLYVNQYDKSQREADGDAWNALGLSLLVWIEVFSERPDVYNGERKVEIKAYEGRKLIHSSTARTGYFRTNSYYVPVFLYGPFCQDIRIEARMVGQQKPSSISRKLIFACGE